MLVILAASAAVVVPAFSKSSAPDLKAAARALAAGLRHTRTEAISSNEQQTLEIDAENRRFTMPGRKGGYPVPDSVGIELYTAQSEQVEEKTGAIRFFPDGSSTGGRISLSAGKLKLHVDVSWLTGRVRILDDAPLERS